MKRDTIHILVVEDNPADARLIVEMLKECTDPSFKLSHADRLGTALAMLEKKEYDVVLLDLGLPDSAGLSGLERIIAQDRRMPVIVLTRTDDETIGIEALQKSASDYLVKGQINERLLRRSMQYALERKRTEEAIQAQRQLLQIIIDHMPAAVNLIRGSDLRIQIVNPAYQAIAPGKEMVGKTLDELWPETERSFVDLCRQVLATGEPHNAVDEPYMISRSPGGPLESAYLTWSLFRVHMPGDEGWAILNTAWETTERKRAENAVREKEKDLNRAQAVARTGSWRLNVQRNELVWSDENHRIFGIPKGPPMTYETFLSRVHPDDRDYVDEKWNAALRGERYDVEHRIIVGGEIRWVRERAELEVGPDGALLGGFGTTQDITERKRAEEEIERSRLWLERVAGTTPDIIFVLDIVNDRNVYANKSVIELLGYSPEEFGGIGDILERAIEPEDRSRVVEFYRQMTDARRGEVRVLTIRALHKDGRTLWLENRVTPFSWDENGELKEIIGISHDVTDLTRAQEVLRRDRETFERLVDERTAELVDIHHELDKARHLSDIGMLASTVAHELRNPLGVIKTAAYNINRKKQGDALDKHVRTINKKVDESNQIINNLLMYARIKQPSYETVRVGDLLRESIESVKARTEGRSVTFRDECAPVENIVATLDPLQITEVMSNILMNAVQAIPTESCGSVTVSGRSFDGLLHIRVTDTGTGIDPDVLPHVFEPFFTSKSKGTGLGLSLCRELVSLHDGSINIESEPGMGATVTVVLPLSPGTHPATT